MKVKKLPQEKRPYEARKLKRKLSSLWKEIECRLVNNEAPDFIIMNEFSDLVTEYDKMAHSNWFEDWQLFTALIKRLSMAVKNQDFYLAKELSDEINEQVSLCHGKYR